MGPKDRKEKYLGWSIYVYRKALKLGILEMPEYCEICHTRKAMDGHHEYYSRPLDVVFCCRHCHHSLHLLELHGMSLAWAVWTLKGISRRIVRAPKLIGVEFDRTIFLDVLQTKPFSCQEDIEYSFTSMYIYK